MNKTSLCKFCIIISCSLLLTINLIPVVQAIEIDKEIISLMNNKIDQIKNNNDNGQNILSTLIKLIVIIFTSIIGFLMSTIVIAALIYIYVRNMIGPSPE